MPRMTKSTKSERSEQRDETELLIKLADMFHEHGLNLPRRIVYLGAEEETDVKMAERFVKNMVLLETISSEQPITVIMNNPGGDVYHGMACYDAIQMCDCWVTGLVVGHAMSMGSMILQACDWRTMAPNSTQMIHYGSMASDAHAKTFLQHAKEAERLDEVEEEIYLRRVREKHPAYTLEDLRKVLNFDHFYTAEESVALGIADEVA